MRLKKYFYTLTAFLVFSCEYSGTVTSYIRNETSHQIELHFYANGMEEVSGKLSLAPLSKTKVSAYAADGGSYYGQFLSYVMDSLVVDIDDRQAIHYSYNNPGSNPEAIVYNQPRNFFYKRSWDLHVLKSNRHHFDGDYTYTFTEQDYLDAN